MSNIWAENDGVMSMRIGRVFPKKHNSTFNYFIENFGQKIWDKDNSEKLKEIKELMLSKKDKPQSIFRKFNKYLF